MISRSSINAVLAATLFIISACNDRAGSSGSQTSTLPPSNTQQQPSTSSNGGSCGEANSGVLIDGKCLYPPAFADRENGPIAGDTGTRPQFHTENYSGSPEAKIATAGLAASAVGGAVILDRVYETTSTVSFYEGVMYTGGGLKRAPTPHTIVTVAVVPGDKCATVESVEGFRLAHVMANSDSSDRGTIGLFSVAAIDTLNAKLCSSSSIGLSLPVGTHVFHEFALAKTAKAISSGVVIDSVLFDGNVQHNKWTHDWRYNNTLFFRGQSTIRGSYFFDTPSENLTICGGTFSNNVAFNLGGSFVHKSCPASLDGTSDEITGNYVEQSNQIGDKIMGHSEGVVTFSALAKNLHLSGNIFRFGREGVFGQADNFDQPMYSTTNFYSHFPHLIIYKSGAEPSEFHFTDDTLLDIAMNSPVIKVLEVIRKQGTPKSRSKIAIVSDVETPKETINVTAPGIPAEIGLSGIQNQSGNITADVEASCTAPLNQNIVTLSALDITGQTTTASLIVNVSANTSPKIGPYSNVVVAMSSNLVVRPGGIPSDNGTISTFKVIAPATFTGSVTADKVTGEISFSDIQPIGTHTIQVLATDNCGATTTKTFKLTVTQ